MTSSAETVGVMHCSLSLNESVGSKVYCAFLDVSKAFDKVLINGLIKKLIDRNVPYELVSILYTWFRCLSCYVSWNSLVSPPFPILCGVRQGGILFLSYLRFTWMI